MRSNLFWLSDKQWQRIEPLLPTDVRGKDHVDDRLTRQGVQDVDRPAHVQALAQPTRSGSARVQDKPLGIVPCS